MIRLLNILAILGLIASAAYAYSIKYETIYQAERLAKTKARIQKEKDAIAVLKAEWQLLNRPDRLQSLADRHLPDIVPLGPQQLARLTDLPMRPERGDEIGRKLDALSSLLETATPKAKSPDPAAKPSEKSSRTPNRPASEAQNPTTTGSLGRLIEQWENRQ